jgi:3-oxoacyl-[acyl-carrier protein] reductase
MDLGISGKHCFVTGASSGIGRSTAVALAAEGAVVSISGRDEGALAETHNMIAARDGSVLHVLRFDLSQADGIEAAA